MSACDPQLLSAYLDDELDAANRARVEEHVVSCPTCAAELKSLRDASQLMSQVTVQPLSRQELDRLHDAIDASADQSILRLGLTIGALAASVLVISCVWLAQLTAPAQIRVASTPAPAWERMAMTLRPEPLVPLDDRGAVQLADAQLADWMLLNLSQKVQP